MSTLPQIAPHIAQHKHLIIHGFTFMSLIISSVVSAASGFGLGWYIKGRGMAGVKIDLANIKTDIENLKAKFSAPVSTPVV